MVKRKVLTESETTELSWFFEQATVGGCNCWKLLNDPKFFVMTDVTKTQTRLALRGMSKLEAMERYIQLVEVLVEKYGPHFPSTFNGSLASLDSGTGSTCCSCNPRN
ncbi:unnamed protein product [Allacma fusca]|uniref:ACB domain-containing protein n=1 Tax=Allacma fusca TaxID=39272 RepID=A0A8J2K3B9_9HEXA|nr:unnamed protein product [Allacma fusca]